MTEATGRGPGPSCACGSGEAMGKFGLTWTRYRDLSGFGSVEVRERRQRYRCGDCSATWSGRPAGVIERFRMTERLADTVAASCLVQTFAAVSDRYGLARKTVRDVFAARSAALLEVADGLVPDTVAFTMPPGERVRLILMHDLAAGRPINAFAPEDTDRLARVLRGIPAGAVAHVDHRAAGLVERAAAGRIAVCIHRGSASDAIEKRLPDAVRRLAQAARPGDAPAIRDAAPLLVLGRYALSPDQAARIDRASADVPLLGLFVERRDALRAIWRSPDLDDARRVADAWVGGLDGRMAEAFAKVREWLLGRRGQVFCDAYGAIPSRAWRLVDGAMPSVLPGDSVHRAVVRTVSGILAGENTAADPVHDLRPGAFRIGREIR